MTNAMIWTFGFLLFIVLMTLVGKLDSGRRYGRNARQSVGSSADMKVVVSDLAEVKQRLTTIEDILRSVE